jgi:hypothetical protein
MLTPAEHRILFAYCADHPVARCIPCDAEYRPDQLASASFHGLGHCCPTCRADLSSSAEEHLRTCTVINVQAAETQDRVRETGQLTRQSRKMITRR